ncbi:hypothetical protein Syun_015599 [Stephania yunnanensis]|uniref:Leucine-rich repeat-containing N-terminal plant-type domain-containing protein n=1 Tax=Stephania yunnanensis TaxID=152371 RepID=A0AAP0PAP4_9MAGN
MSAAGLSFILLLLTLSELSLKAASTTHWGDVEVLKELKNGLDPGSISPGSCLSSWDFSVDPCDHIFSDHFTCGFRCDAMDVSGQSRVTEISLDQAGYSGSISSSSWDLPYLHTLDLSNNFLSGQIPNSISNLTALQRLTLSANMLSGEIPSSIGSLSAFEELYLDNNWFEGTVPTSLTNMGSLRRLEIQGNKLSGEFPDMGALKSLSFFDCSDNSFIGGVPVDFPSSVVEISMRNNSLEGNLPSNIGDMGFLQVLDLSHNRINGPVFSVLFNHPSLQQLTLSHNNFSYLQVPGTLGTQSELIALDVSNNGLQGMLPAFLGMMPRLAVLSLENNMFTGMIPPQYAVKAVFPVEGASSFERLLLGGNYLFGPIPRALLNLKPGNANVSLVDNCLFRCPQSYFFCRGAVQKSSVACRSFGLVLIP